MRNLLKTAAVFFFFFAGITPAYAERQLPPLGDKTLSMDLQNANLKDVLKIFSIQSGINFIAAQNVEDRKITLFLDKVPIQEAMEKLFEANNLTYEHDSAANLYVVKYWGEPQVDLMTKIYTLKNRSVTSSRIEKERDALMKESGVGKGMSSTASEGESSASSSGADDSSFKSTIKQVLSKEGKISEDKRTNCLIITDIPGRFPVIDELIARLDIPQPMVMLEVEMLDVSKSLLDNLGFNIDANSLNINFTRGFSLKGLEALVTGASPSGSGGRLSFGRSQDFRYSLLLDFLRTQTDTRLLARPKVMTLNNETAEIGVVRDEIVGQKQTVTSTTGGLDQSSIEYERATSLSLTQEGVGVFLRVTPQVNLDTGEIMLVINPKTSTTSQSPQVPVGTVARDPEIRMTKSIVKVKDGETIALGGLIHQERQTTLKKLPVLGDLPFVGMLFRHKSTDTDIDRELLVFITPRIVKDPDLTVSEPSSPAYALQYLSSGLKRDQEIKQLLDTHEGK